MKWLSWIPSIFSKIEYIKKGAKILTIIVETVEFAKERLIAEELFISGDDKETIEKMTKIGE